MNGFKWHIKEDKLPVNPPELFTPTRCRVLKAFCIKGKPVAVGEVIVLARHDATSLLLEYHRFKW